MSSKPDSSDTVIHASPGAQPRRYCSGNAPKTKAITAEEVSPPLVVISEHEVALGTAAAIAITPSLDGELTSEDAVLATGHAAAEMPAAPSRSGWIGALARLFTPPPGRRPRRTVHRVHYDCIADARMAREMHRL